MFDNTSLSFADLKDRLSEYDKSRFTEGAFKGAFPEVNYTSETALFGYEPFIIRDNMIVGCFEDATNTQPFKLTKLLAFVNKPPNDGDRSYV